MHHGQDIDSAAHGTDAQDHRPSGGCCGGASRSATGAGSGCCGGSGGCSDSSSFCCSSHDQILVFTRAQSREVDRLAETEFHMPTLLLMENAARGVSSIILEGLQGIAAPTVLVVCGPGNNGGDGLAIARHLSNRGVSVGVVLAAEESRHTGDARVNLDICRAMGLPIVQAHADPARAMDQMLALIGEPQVVVDCLLGTGATSAAHGPIAALIDRVNAQRTRGSSVISVDLPSGLDCDSGLPCPESLGGAPGPCVRADLTVALAGVKAGFMNEGAQQYVGELVVVDIGAPAALLDRIGTPMTAFTESPSSQ